MSSISPYPVQSSLSACAPGFLSSTSGGREQGWTVGRSLIKIITATFRDFLSHVAQPRPEITKPGEAISPTLSLDAASATTAVVRLEFESRRRRTDRRWPQILILHSTQNCCSKSDVMGEIGTKTKSTLSKCRGIDTSPATRPGSPLAAMTQ